MIVAGGSIIKNNYLLFIKQNLKNKFS